MKRQRLYTKRNFIDILERQFHLLHECIAIHYPQCYTNIKSYIFFRVVSSYAQNQRQQEPCYCIYRFRCSDWKIVEGQEGLSKTVAQIEELKTDIKSLHESLKPQKAEIKQTEKEIEKLEAKKAATEAKAAEAVLKKLLASGMTADEILAKLK